MVCSFILLLCLVFCVNLVLRTCVFILYWLNALPVIFVTSGRSSASGIPRATDLLLLVFLIFLAHLVHVTHIVVHICGSTCNQLFADINCWTQLCEWNMLSRKLCVWEIVLLSGEACDHQVALTPGQRTEMDGGADWGENDLKISQPAIVRISGSCKKRAVTTGVVMNQSQRCSCILRYANGDQREGFFTDSSLEGQVQKLS